MTITKATITDEIRDQLNIPNAQSVEMAETLLEIIKKTLNPVIMLWCQGSGNSQ